MTCLSEEWPVGVESAKIGIDFALVSAGTPSRTRWLEPSSRAHAGAFL